MNVERIRDTGRTMTIKAIGFDMDGTLVNTHVNYVDLNDVNRFVLQPLGFPVDEMWPDGNMTSRQPFYDWMCTPLGRTPWITSL